MAYKRQFYPGDSIPAKNRRKYMDPKVKLKKLRTVAMDDVIRIMGHGDDGDVPVIEQGTDLSPYPAPQQGVERRKRLVEQEQLRSSRQGTSHGYTLTLSRRQLMRKEVHLLCKTDQLQLMNCLFFCLFL